MSLSIRAAFGLVVAACGASLAPAFAADAQAGRRKAEPCFACHGADGNSSNPAYPSLAAQAPLYLYYQLLQFREQRPELGVRRARGSADDVGEHGDAQFELRFRHRFIPDEC